MPNKTEGIRASIEQAKVEFIAEVTEADDEPRAAIAKYRELVASITKDLLDKYERTRASDGILAALGVRNGVGARMAIEISPLEREMVRTILADEVYWVEGTGVIVVRIQRAHD